MRVSCPRRRSGAGSLRVACTGLILALLLGPHTLHAQLGQSTQPATGAWQILHEHYYGDREMGVVDEKFMSLEAPANTPDPAATPLTLRFTPDPARPVRRVRIFIDNNPSPVVGTFEFPTQFHFTQIDLRVRIDRFTSVRAVAELANGDLEMRSAWVQAAGGCSAPPAASGGGQLGEIRVRAAPDASWMQVSIRHPNSSGFQIDPRTGAPIPPHYISHLRLNSGSQMLLDADLGISISENPTLRLATDTPLPAPVTVDALDSVTQAHYTQQHEAPAG